MHKTPLPIDPDRLFSALRQAAAPQPVRPTALTDRIMEVVERTPRHPDSIHRLTWRQAAAALLVLAALGTPFLIPRETHFTTVSEDILNYRQQIFNRIERHPESRWRALIHHHPYDHLQQLSHETAI